MNVVEVGEVNKTFDRKHVLKRLSLTGQQGDVDGPTRGGGHNAMRSNSLAFGGHDE